MNVRTATLAIFLLGVLGGGLAVAAPPVGASGFEPNLLDVKFKEGTTVRLRGGRPADMGDDPAVRSDLQGLLQAFGEDTWNRTHSVDEGVLDRLRRDGQANSTRPLPDLNNYFRLHLPPGLTAARAKEIIERYASVQAAYFVPEPAVSPVAPDYSGPPQSVYQDYLDAAPAGIDARNAWSRGWSGAGVKVCDVEYWVNPTHQDLPPISIVGHPPVDPWQDDHGTGVWGEIVSKNDGTGTKGIAYGVSGYLAGATTEIGYSVARPLMECGAALSAGDVVLIEQQMYGPNDWFGTPTEWSKPVYDAIVTLVANGIVVVETTGNGNNGIGLNLDDTAFSTGNDDHWPFLVENDSGALLVTAGRSPHSGTPRSYHPWSDYGASVDLQGWGDSIVTTGAGNLYSAEGKNLYYRSDFGGSSGAGPIVTGAVALLQHAHKQLYNAPAPPALIKHILVSTGTPQAGARHLGPLPNLKAALDALQQAYYVDSTAPGLNNGTSWSNAFHELQEALALATPGARIFVAEGTYPPDWNPATNVRTGNRADTFQMKNGVTLLGGYPHGGGTRDPGTHPSILSGSIGAAGTSDDSYHVVAAGSGIDDSAVLDGFTVTFGRADGANPNDRGGGILLQSSSPVLRQLVVQQNFAAARGGGIYNEGGSPSLQRVTLATNTSSNKGGGMWNENGGPHFTQVTFSGNVATSEGGGLFTEGGTPHIEEAKFISNQATRGGGLSQWLGATPGGSMIVDSAEFRGNQASDLGGAVFDWQALLRLNNVTVSANTATTGGGGIYVFTASTVTIRNSICWANTGGNISGSTADVSTSIVQGGYTGTGILTGDPLFRVASSDLRVKAGSPALDAGTRSTCAAADVRGVSRDPQSACDLGAYEYLGDPGTFWTNGEVDLILAGESYDPVPVGVSLRESADDFVVPAGKVCDVSGFRGVLQDGTKVSDAVAKLYQDASGVPGAELASWSVNPYCENSPSTACEDFRDCLVSRACTVSSDCNDPNFPNDHTDDDHVCATGQCRAPCVQPGQSLGHRSAGRLWEPSFTVSKRLGSGTYWLSIYGTKETGSTDYAYAISAGEGAVRSNEFQFRQVGFSWVNGGPFYGSAPRDLALDVDAVCLTDADGDLSEAGVDCDDANPSRFPGNSELCDGIDNNCDGVADSGAAPSGVPTLLVPSRTQLSWSAIAGATGYDVVHGQVSQLRSTGGDFTYATCEANEVPTTTLAISGAAPPAGGLWYLVRPSSVCGVGTYNTGSPRQVQSRDAEIAASVSACP
jgi:serine protease